jgi:hypothetical protein
VAPTYFSDRIPAITQQQSRWLAQGMTKIGLLDADSFILGDPERNKFNMRVRCHLWLHRGCCKDQAGRCAARDPLPGVLVCFQSVGLPPTASIRHADAWTLQLKHQPQLVSVLFFGTEQDIPRL